jgi:Na+-translocating ferredoxin:NAD+ oxidoreductase RnfG subunit
MESVNLKSSRRNAARRVSGAAKVYRIALVVIVLLAMAPAETLLTQEQALKVVFPRSESVQPETKVLTAEQRSELENNTGLRFPEAEYPTFVAKSKNATDGYAVILNEIGKHENITFIVGVSPKGKVLEVAIMEYRESRGSEVKEQRFLKQFRGKTSSDPIRVNQDIVNYTGATLSSYAIARGVRRALALTHLFYGTGK